MWMVFSGSMVFSDGLAIAALQQIGSHAQVVESPIAALLEEREFQRYWASRGLPAPRAVNLPNDPTSEPARPPRNCDAADVILVRNDLLAVSDQLLAERNAAFTAGDRAKVAVAEAEFDRIALVLSTVEFAISNQQALNMNAVAARLQESVEAQRAIGLSTAATKLGELVGRIRGSVVSTTATGKTSTSSVSEAGLIDEALRERVIPTRSALADRAFLSAGPRRRANWLYQRYVRRLCADIRQIQNWGPRRN